MYELALGWQSRRKRGGGKILRENETRTCLSLSDSLLKPSLKYLHLVSKYKQVLAIFISSLKRIAPTVILFHHSFIEDKKE